MLYVEQFPAVSIWQLRSVGQQAAFDQHWRMAVVGGLLVGVGPAEQVAVVPAAGGEFKTEGQAAGIEASDYDDSRDAEDVDPAGLAVRAATDFAVLRHGFIGRRHLGGGVDVAVQVVVIQCFIEYLEGCLARFDDVGGIGGVGFDVSLALGGKFAPVLDA
jgi:hypothetical protein